jgi:hypothetical protein
VDGGRVPTLAELRENKVAVLEFLRGRTKPAENQFSRFPSHRAWQTEKLESWPPESIDAERRFRQPHAKLLHYLAGIRRICLDEANKRPCVLCVWPIRCLGVSCVLSV